MNAIQFKQKLKTIDTLIIPKIDYIFLKRIVVSNGNFEYPITQRLTNEQYNLFNVILMVEINKRLKREYNIRN